MLSKVRFASTPAWKGVGMPRRSRSSWRSVAPLVLTLALGAALVACESGEDAPEPTGATLAERWLRAGEERNAGITVYENALPPYFSDLLNPDRTADTPPEDLLAFPVHPASQLLGSYDLRRPDGSRIVWLFYDVPAATVGAVTDAITGQLDASPWQVTSQSGSRSNRLVAFTSTRSEDVTGTAIVEGTAGTADVTVVVDRDGGEVTLTIPRASSVPLLEASFDGNLVAQDVFPGVARTAGLQEGDEVLRVGDTEVGTPEDLQRAFEDLARGEGTVSLLYVLQFTPPLQAEAPPFVPAAGLELPADFPVRDAWAAFSLDTFESSQEATGQYHFAAMFSEDTPTVVADQVRDALEAAGWQIVSDEAQGFGTMMEFAHEGDELVGVVSIDESALDDSLTQVFVQIQSAPPVGS